jgi:hypothetical protein
MLSLGVDHPVALVHVALVATEPYRVQSEDLRFYFILVNLFSSSLLYLLPFNWWLRGHFTA